MNNPLPCNNVALLHPPPALDDESLSKLRRVARPMRRLQRRTQLYRIGMPFQAIYVVVSGAMKSYRIAPSGGEEVAAFHLPGEFLGLSAIGCGHYPYHAVALQPTRLCALPYERLSELAREIPSLQRQLLRLMSGAIAREERLLEAVAGRSAEQRLAFMLIDLRQRLPRGRASPDVLRLPMSRAELGGFVGLAAETTSRVLRCFERRGWISTNGPVIVLRRPQALRRLVRWLVRGTAA